VLLVVVDLDGGAPLADLLGQDFVFTDLRAHYAAATYLQFGKHFEWPLEKWVHKVARGGLQSHGCPCVPCQVRVCFVTAVEVIRSVSSCRSCKNEPSIRFDKATALNCDSHV
jgi:hypothetical protein